MGRILPALALAVLAATAVVAEDALKCSLDNKCPEETPCCSQYGQCGVGAYCLGGCDPLMSFSLDACVPAPVCADRTLKMDNTDGIADVGDYLGDPTKADWVAQGTAVPYKGKTLLTMPKNSVGTVLASTVYMWYGNIKASMKTSRGAGVVTAFILLSDVKDEIDYEWVGVDLATAQTNYYFQGIPDYTHSGNITDLEDTYDGFHDYEIRWTPEQIQWVVDGKVGRTQKKKDTWNETANRYDYPQTPARVQLSIWPGGAASNGQGTIDWAGGAIDWNSADIQRDGYYYASVGEVTLECYKTDKAPGTNSGTSYVYTDISGTEDAIEDGDADTVLKSLLGTGLDMDKENPKNTAGQTTQANVPGLSGGGVGSNGQAQNDANGGGDAGTATGSSDGAVCTNGFSQVCGSDSSSSSDNQNQGVKQDHMLGASAFAALVAVAGMLWL